MLLAPLIALIELSLALRVMTHYEQFTLAYLHSLPQTKQKELLERRTQSGYSLDYMERANLLQPDAKQDYTFATDTQAYYDFPQTFSAKISNWSKCNPYKQKIPDPHFGIVSLDNLKLKNEDLTILEEKVESSRLRLARNLAGFPLRSTMTPQQLTEVQAQFLKAAEKLPASLQGTYEPLAQMSEERYQSLQKKGIMYNKNQQRLIDANILRHLPVGCGLYLSHDQKLMVWLGEQDHLKICVMTEGGDVALLYSLMSQVMSILEKELDFAYDDTLGYFTSHPDNIGTGMRLSFKLHLMNVNQTFVQEFAHDHDIEARGKRGQNFAIEGTTYFMSNSRLACSSVAYFVRNTCSAVAELIRRDQQIEKHTQ